MCCAILFALHSAHADDTELLIHATSVDAIAASDRIDALSDATQLVAEPYAGNQRYSGNCDGDSIYWSDVEATPDCTTTLNRIDKRDFLCRAAAERLATHGRASHMLAQYRNGGGDGGSIGPYRWQFLVPGHANSPVECEADHGVHGDGRSSYRWPSAGTNVSDPFTDSANNALAWGSTPRNRHYTVYDGNFLNWLHGQTGLSASATAPAADELTEDSCAVQDSLSFTQPIVAANPINRTQHLNDIYLSTFDIRARTRWPGELTKHRIDANGIDQSRSAWQQRPAPPARRLFSNIVSDDLTAAGNAIASGNQALDAEHLGLSGAAGEPTLEELIDWMHGADEANATGPMGDTLHAQAAAVVYGGSAADPETVIFTATNDGYLHAISGQDGSELWAFVPEQLLANQARLYYDRAAWHKHYGLDGDVVPVIKDANHDGRIEADDGDFVYLIFGMRRGGQTYFALDVTDQNSPELLWFFDSKESGESWSTPSIARMNIAGSLQNPDKAVVVIGGGYDTVHDTATHPAGADGSGAGIHILDLVSGERLWRAGMDAGANLLLNAVDREMDRAIPNQVRVIDLNGDGLADRMYASDLGGQIWRFDVSNGQSANELISGGVIAQLGADGVRSSPTAAETRRFYNAPDVSLITDVQQQKRYMAISIGSGYRAHPLDVSASDRFFSIRDPDVFKPLSQQDYDNYAVITTDDLVEVSGRTQTVIGVDDRGWMLTLPANEKILADSLTFNDQVLFVAFSTDSRAATSCSASSGRNQLYRMNVVNGDAIGPGIETLQVGIAPSPLAIFPGPDLNCTDDQCNIRPLVCVGAECFDPEHDAAPVRTLWTQDGVE